MVCVRRCAVARSLGHISEQHLENSGFPGGWCSGQGQSGIGGMVRLSRCALFMSYTFGLLWWMGGGG